jgi:hypothetical protein
MRIGHHLYAGLVGEHHFMGVRPKELIVEPLGGG